MRVLVCEDNSLTLRSIEYVLKNAGFEVLMAIDGDQGIRILDEQEVDLVITDIVMPGRLLGTTLSAELRLLAPDLPIIFMSGYAEEAFRKNLDTKEEFGFLPKPFSLKQLAAKVKDTLQA